MKKKRFVENYPRLFCYCIVRKIKDFLGDSFRLTKTTGIGRVKYGLVQLSSSNVPPPKASCFLSGIDVVEQPEGWEVTKTKKRK